MKLTIMFVLFIIISLTAKAVLELPLIFADNMILQREKPLQIWGKSLSGNKVSVNFNHQIRTVITDKNGNWKILFAPLKTGGPYVLQVSSEGDTIILKNILIGDVWICAGQSNMNFILAAEKNGKAELDNLHNGNIREYRCAMPENVENPENKDHSQWIAANGEKAAMFSAVGYYFAKKVQSAEHIPIGIIVMACGNTRAESWTDTNVLRLYPSLQPLLDHWQKRRTANDMVINHEPGIFYGAVVKPLVPFVIKGVVWYQGESNTLPDNSGRSINDRAVEYKDLLKALIYNWRRDLKQQKLPFYIIQLPNYKQSLQDLQWANIRQAQLEVTKEMQHVSMAVTIDLGDSTNIHPNNKQAVGERVANQALVNEYHHRSIAASGPLVRNIKIMNNKVILSFDYTGSGLAGIDGKRLEGFEIAGSTHPGLFIKADAHIQNNSVIVSSDKALHPVAVRYAWADNPVVSLFIKEGLPASPFLIKAANFLKR